MRLARHHRHYSLTFNMTPMIDIVFLLIIFFMTVSQITRVNEDPVDLPRLEGLEDTEPETFTINIRADGNLAISGRTVLLSDAVLFVGQELAAKQGDSTAIRVFVRCDRRAPSDVVNQLVRQLVDLGIRQIRVGVESSAAG